MGSRNNAVQNLNGFPDDDDYEYTDDDTPTPPPTRGNQRDVVTQPRFNKQRPGTLPNVPDRPLNPPPPPNRGNTQQQNQKGNNQKQQRNPNASVAAENYIFDGRQLHIMGLLVLAGWLNDENLRQQYRQRLIKKVGDESLLTPLFEQIIESVETGFALAKPPMILSAALLQKFLNGRKIDVRDVERLNTIYLAKYFNLDEAPGITIERMLIDERLINPSGATPVNLQEVLATTEMVTAKDIVSIKVVERSDYNDAVQAHARTLGMHEKYTAFMDEVYFHQYLVYDGKFITEWLVHDKHIRVTSESVFMYDNGDSIHKCSIVMMT